jgi:endonuclease G, mitochondrial
MAIGRILLLLAAWAVPVAAAAQNPEVHTFHCLHSCPTGTPASNDLVVRERYTLSSNDATKFADWVAYRITAQSLGGGNRSWRADPWLDPSETLEPDDYAGVGAVQIDRGHQAPLASLGGGGLAAETNFLSNITPQKAPLNQNPWRLLEDAERALLRSGRVPVFVLTGPLYEAPRPPLPGADEPHRVPSGYWKVVMTEDGRLSAFIMAQDLPRSALYCDQRATLDEVERRSGLRLFPRLARRNFTSLDSALGCS